MKNPSSSGKVDLLEIIKGWWRFIAGFISAIGLIVGFIQLWRGDRTTVNIVVLVTSTVLLSAFLGWVGFRQKESGIYDVKGKLKKVYSPYFFKVFLRLHIYIWARIGLILIFAGLIGVGYFLFQQQQVLKSKIVIIVTEISGPDADKYRLTDSLISQLNHELIGYDDTIIIGIPQAISEQQGSNYARHLGEQYNADLVLWGWYGSTSSTVRLTLHVENLNIHQFSELDSSESLQAQSKMADLETFTLQQNLGARMGAIVLFLRGITRFEAGDNNDALGCFDSAINHPEWSSEFISKSKAYFYRGYINLEQGHNLDAISDYSHVLQLDPNFASAYNNRGNAYFGNGENEKAIADYSENIRLEPKNGIAFYNRGLVYYTLGEVDKALENYSKTIKFEPTFPAAYNNRGIIYFGKSEYDKALVDYSQAIKLDPKYTGAFINRGLAFQDMGRNEKAVQDYNQAIQLNPNFAETYYNRGNLFDDEGNYDKAIEDYSKALLLNPTYEAAYNNRGLSYRSKGELDKAIADYTKAIQLNQTADGTYINRGLAHSAKGDYDKAIADYEQAIQINSKNPAAYYNRAVTLFKLGFYDKALIDLLEAKRLTTDANRLKNIDNLINALPKITPMP